MLPLYKLLSLFLRVFSRPFINMTKKYHASNQVKNSYLQALFLKLGNWFHIFETRINRKFLKSQGNGVVKPISSEKTLEKGIEFFYEIVFYSIAFGFPMYELYRGTVDTKKKDVKMEERMKRIEDRVDGIQGYIERIEKSLKSQMSPLDQTEQIIENNIPFILFSSFSKNNLILNIL